MNSVNSHSGTELYGEFPLPVIRVRVPNCTGAFRARTSVEIIVLDSTKLVLQRIAAPLTLRVYRSVYDHHSLAVNPCSW